MQGVLHIDIQELLLLLLLLQAAASILLFLLLALLLAGRGVVAWDWDFVALFVATDAVL